MSTLLLRCQGPLQAWGTRSRFEQRDTEREPSKSGVIGLLCAALGRGRDEALDDLARLRMGVRADREGILMRDYHTAQNVIKASGSHPKENEAVLSNRYYLADAAFLVGLEGEDALLQTLYNALNNPVWPLFLGRKSCPPSPPVFLPDGLKHDESLRTALTRYPLLEEPREIDTDGIRLILETETDEGSLHQDTPLSFLSSNRRFATRRVVMDHTAKPEGRWMKEEPCT